MAYLLLYGHEKPRNVDGLRVRLHVRHFLTSVPGTCTQMSARVEDSDETSRKQVLIYRLLRESSAQDVEFILRVGLTNVR
jgi:hypothetical protein